MLGRRGQKHGLGAGDDRGAEVNLIERVGNQDHWAPGVLFHGHHRLPHHEQRLARPRDGQDLAIAIECPFAEAVTTGEPRPHRRAELGRTVDRRIPSPKMRVLRKRASDDRGWRVLRLAQMKRERFGVRGRRQGPEKVPQALERIVRKPVEPVVEHRRTALRRDRPAV